MMKPLQHILPLLSLALLASCVSTEGLSKESSKIPRGNPNSSLLVEEFSDFECPACQVIDIATVRPLLKQYGSIIRYEFNHMPLKIHPFAQGAAEASECAADQGKFWEFLDDVYASSESQDHLTFDDNVKRAETIGVFDIELFKRCIKSGIKRERVRADYDEGVAREVRGTPTFFVAGEKATTNSLSELQRMIEKRLQQRL